MKSSKIEVSYKTIIFTMLFLIALALLWNIRSIIILFFICFILMEALNPTVAFLEKLKIPRVLGITSIYSVIIFIFYIVFSSIIPILIEQTTGLIKALPDIIQNTTLLGTSAVDLSSQFKILEPLPGNIANIAVSIVSNLFSTIIILVVTFYMLLEKKRLHNHSLKYCGNNIGCKIINVIDELEIKLGGWVNSQLILMTTIAIFSYIGYLLIGLKYALPLALVAGLLSIIPVVGSIVAVLFAAIIGLTISPTIALLTIIIGIAIHLIENNLIIPKIMKETCNINPIITIFLLIIGAKLDGITGTVLAVPVYMTIEIIYKVFLSKNFKLN